MSLIDNIKKYIKNNKLYIAIMIIGIISYVIQMKYVVLYADDLSLGVIAKKGGIFGAFSHLKENYMNWGGGPTPFIAIIFMLFPIKVWKVFSCILIFITIVLSVKMITYKNNFNKGIIAAIIWSCIYILNIYISRETLYWMDGSLAYVLTAVQFLIYFYYMYSKIIMKNKIRKIDYVLLPVLAFFSGWTGPQVAGITVIAGIILIVWEKLINKEKIKKIYIITVFFSILGCLVEIMAPGNNIRMEIGFPEFAKMGIFEKIEYRAFSIFTLIFNYFTYNFASISFYMLLTMGIMAFLSYNFCKDEQHNKIQMFIKSISIFLIIFIIGMLALRLGISSVNLLEYNATNKFIAIIMYFISIIAIFLSIVLALYISLKKKNPLLVILFLSAVLGQLMMLIAPYSPLRSTFITIYLLWIIIGYLLVIAEKSNINVASMCTLALIITKLEFGVFALCVYVVYKKLFNKPNNEIYITTLILIILALNNWVVLVKNYKANYEIYYENIIRIEKFDKNDENKLILLSPKDEAYGFNKFVGIEWIEKAVKEYFELGDIELLEEKK